VDVVQDLLAETGGWGAHTSVCGAQKTGPRGVVDGWGIVGRSSRGHYGGLDRSVERIDQGGYAGVEQGDV
jgi:hypothetical protein